MSLLNLRIDRADSFWRRFRGLMLTPCLAEDEGLLFRRCDSIHTCFMRYAIDVVYLDRSATIVKLADRVAPWRFSLGGRSAVHTLELAPGAIARLGFKTGDCLAVHPALKDLAA